MNDKNTPMLIMTVGLPASGKSTIASQLSIENNAVVLSSDMLREQMYGDVNDQNHNDKIFAELHRRIKELLYNGQNVVYDATNISRKNRVSFLTEIKDIPCYKIAAVMAVPYEICLMRNTQRSRVVPEEVIWKMYKSFQIPCTQEGFDEVIEKNDFHGYYDTIESFLQKSADFNQENKNHTLTLGNHCKKAWNYCHTHHWDALEEAVALHDNGKLICKTFYNTKGEKSEDAHYYGHEFLSAYRSLFYWKQNDNLHTALLIEYHMKPYLSWNESTKAKQKDLSRFGQNFIDDIYKIHECDVQAH